MGFFDGEVENSLDRLFDLDGDGYLDTAERVLEFGVLSGEMDEFDSFDNDFDSDYDEY